MSHRDAVGTPSNSYPYSLNHSITMLVKDMCAILLSQIEENSILVDDSFSTISFELDRAQGVYQLKRSMTTDNRIRFALRVDLPHLRHKVSLSSGDDSTEEGTPWESFWDELMRINSCLYMKDTDEVCTQFDEWLIEERRGFPKNKLNEGIWPAYKAARDIRSKRL